MEESGYSESDGAYHQHFCEECGEIWSHDDESCVGPRFAGRATWGGKWTCPLCVDEPQR